MNKPETHDPFDFWYAVNQTEILLMPARRLETFGNTLVNYHMVSEPMDSTSQTRVREGRIQAFRPQILTPQSYANSMLDGFGKEAEAYAEWLRDHAQDLHILRYGFQIRKEETQELLLAENYETVKEQVRERVQAKADPLSAVLTGVDHPWEVCLLKLMSDLIRYSVPGNMRELERRRLLDDQGGLPRGVRDELDGDFRSASRDSRLIQPLGAKLQQYGVFEEYQDRFFALVKTGKPK
ncbi:MAG: hypothetical protein R6X19_12170 [Kiritimatiellia bacterium]